MLGRRISRNVLCIFGTGDCSTFIDGPYATVPSVACGGPTQSAPLHEQVYCQRLLSPLDADFLLSVPPSRRRPCCEDVEKTKTVARRVKQHRNFPQSKSYESENVSDACPIGKNPANVRGTSGSHATESFCFWCRLERVRAGFTANTEVDTEGTCSLGAVP